MEALLHNRIVISTIHYVQLKDVKHFVVSSSYEGFIKDIGRISSMSESELLEYANLSEKVISYFSVSVWKRSIDAIENKSINSY